MGHGRQIRRLREPGTLVEMYQFVNQAGAIVDPSSTRHEGVKEQISLLRKAYIDAKQAVDNGDDKEDMVIKKAYNALVNKFED